MSRYSIIGLGKLGVCTAACIASKGFDVVGVDINTKIVENVNNYIAPVSEPMLSDLMMKTKTRKHLRATTSYADAVFNSDISLIIVPTPSEFHGGFSLKYVSMVAREIGKCLSEKQDYHLVDVVSTVLPGSTEFSVKPILEKESGKKCTKDFGLCYNPEFIALGNVIHDFMNPDFVLLGESDEKAGRLLEDGYKSFCDNNPQVYRMNIISAEIAKISLNTYVTTKISYANMLADICERIPNADIDAITQAIGLDTRIGGKYLKAGLGYGGPCFPRDNIALNYIAKQLGVNALIAETTDEVNKHTIERLIKIVKSKYKKGNKVGILGISYKPKTGIVEESQGYLIAKNLSESNIPVFVYDPIIKSNVGLEKNKNIRFSSSLKELLSESDIIFVANPDPVFQEIKAGDFTSKTVIDCWRIFRDILSEKQNVVYLPIGVGLENKESIKYIKNIISNY